MQQTEDNYAKKHSEENPENLRCGKCCHHHSNECAQTCRTMIERLWALDIQKKNSGCQYQYKFNFINQTNKTDITKEDVKMSNTCTAKSLNSTCNRVRKYKYNLNIIFIIRRFQKVLLSNSALLSSAYLVVFSHACEQHFESHHMWAQLPSSRQASSLFSSILFLQSSTRNKVLLVLLLSCWTTRCQALVLSFGFCFMA